MPISYRAFVHRIKSVRRIAVIRLIKEGRHSNHRGGSRRLHFIRLCWQPCLDPSRNAWPESYAWLCSGSALAAVPSAAGCGTNPHAPVTPTLHAETAPRATASLLRAQEIEERAGEPYEQSGE